MLKKEILVKSEDIYKGRLLNIKKETVRVQSGREDIRELALHPDGVCIIAVDENGMVYTVRQYRRPFDDFLLELPAGKIEDGEDPLFAARRELEEETGLSGGEMIYLGGYMVSPGFTDEIDHIYLCLHAKEGETHFDEDEFIEIEKKSLRELIEMTERNEICDAKTAIGILRSARYLGI